MKHYKVWIEVEEWDDSKKGSNFEEYAKAGEPVDIKCKNKRVAFLLQDTLHSIGKVIHDNHTIA